MSFMAGIIDFKGLGLIHGGGRFKRALEKMKEFLPWPLDTIEKGAFIFAQAGFKDMWQGPKILYANKLYSMACGIQGRKISGCKTTLEYLVNHFAAQEPHIDNFFDRFSLAIIDENTRKSILATDPLGISPVFYYMYGTALVFSSHQIFLKYFLGMDFQIDWQGVLEYLVIGHCMGNRTLIKNACLLGPGSMLILENGRCEKKTYFNFDHPVADSISLEEAGDMIMDHLLSKCKAYGSLSTKPTAGFLSGGWDSRLLVSLFLKEQDLRFTYTTQQQIRFQGMLISEKKIAKEVSSFLGVKNRFIAPVYRTPKTRDIRAKRLDYSTWFHDWAFALTEHLPQDRYLFFDGLLGDILLRALFITPELQALINTGQRDKVAELFYEQYISGFNRYTRGVEQWKQVLSPKVMDEFSNQLRQDLYTQFREIRNQDFVSIFLFHNRSRRAISPLPRLLFGSKGEVALPFCDAEFIKKAFSIPLKFRVDGSLYRALLEKSKPGLSKIPSTNSKNFDELKPYLTGSVFDLSLKGRINKGMKMHLPYVRRLKDRIFGKDPDQWAMGIVRKPPEAFFPYLNDNIKSAINCKNLEALKEYRFFMDRIMILEGFFSLK